jgi:hypothetical protein
VASRVPLKQVFWAAIFGVSRLSMMFGMIALNAWLAYLVYRPANGISNGGWEPSALCA